ncbi:MAG: sigma-70 family RNA polymerase sigma factor, partial [Verrucomicrobiae bacterium]|nr:sigma-70 family RNA polymerase sigma factor [Verrucomicrobiae bacterium]
LVFAILLRKAGGVMRHPSLPAWLHKTATLEAMRLMRKERNHQRKLQRFSEMTVNSQPAEIPNPVDSPVLDHLDQAMAALGPIDRQFLMLRFYQGYGMRELASVLGKSEATVRKQSERTLARLRRILHRRGVDASTIALSGLLSSAFAHPASATLITTITQGAAATSASVLPSALVINTLQTMTYGKQIALTAATVALLAAIPVGIQTKRLEDTKSELHTAHAVADPRPKTLTAAPSDTVSFPSANASTPTPGDLRDEAAAKGYSDAEFLRVLLTRPIRPLQGEIDAFIGSHRSVAELRSMFDKVIDLPLGAHQRAAVEKLVSEIGKQDGRYAIELAENFVGANILRQHALEAAYAGWASRQPEAAWAYANSLPPEKLATHPYWNIITGAAQGDLSAQRFYDFVESNSAALLELSAGHLWQGLAHVYEHKDSQGMPAWVEGLPEGPLRNLATSQLIQSWALSDPPAARIWMEANVDPYQDSQPALQLAKAWARVDPSAAMDWLTSLPPDLQTKEQFSGAIEWWLRFDQVGAAGWLAQATPSPLLDIPFERYIDRVRKTNPSEAMNWAMAITDPQNRQRVMKKVASVWSKNDPAGFEQFLVTAPTGTGLK